MTIPNDDDMLPEYDFSKLSRVVRNNQQRAEIMRTQGYSVTVHHEDGTSTTRYVPPSNLMSTDNMSTNQQQHLHGDFIRGDKVMGDKVGGDKIMGDKIMGDKIMGDKIMGDKIGGVQPIVDQGMSDQPISTSQPPAFRQQRLATQHSNLQADWQTRTKKLAQLRQALAIETGAARRFQLEQEVQTEEAAIDRLDEQLADLESKL